MGDLKHRSAAELVEMIRKDYKYAQKLESQVQQMEHDLRVLKKKAHNMAEKVRWENLYLNMRLADGEPV